MRAAAIATLLAVVTSCASTPQTAAAPVVGSSVEDPELRARFARNIGCTADAISAERWDDAAAAIGCGFYGYFQRDEAGTWKRTAFAQLDSDKPVPRNPGMSLLRTTQTPNDLFPFRLLKAPRGAFAADCVLTREGHVRDCEVTRSLGAAADEYILERLTHFRYEPVTYAGYTFAITHEFRLKYQLPVQ